MPIRKIIVHHVPAVSSGTEVGESALFCRGKTQAVRSFFVTFDGNYKELPSLVESNNPSGFINIFCEGDCDIRPPSDLQVQALIELLGQLKTECEISTDEIVTHRDAVEYFDDTAETLCPGLFFLERFEAIRARLGLRDQDPNDFQATITLSGVEHRGDAIVIEGEVVNSGALSWTTIENSGLIRFGARVLDSDRGILVEARVELPQGGVQPKGRAPFTFVFLVSELPEGSHSISIDMVVEGKFWFSRYNSSEVVVELGEELLEADRSFLIEERAALGGLGFVVWFFFSDRELRQALTDESIRKCLVDFKIKGLATVAAILNRSCQLDLLLERQLGNLGIIYEPGGLPALESCVTGIKACVCFSAVEPGSMIEIVHEIFPGVKAFLGILVSPIGLSEDAAHSLLELGLPIDHALDGVRSLEHHIAVGGGQQLLRRLAAPSQLIVILLGSDDRQGSQAWARKVSASHRGIPCQLLFVPSSGFVQDLVNGEAHYGSIRTSGKPHNQTAAVNRIVAANAGADIVLMKEGVQVTEHLWLACLQDEAYSEWATAAVGGVIWSEGFISEGGGELFSSGYVNYFRGPFPEYGVVSVGFVSTWLAYFRGDALTAVGSFYEAIDSLHFAIIEWCCRAKDQGLSCRSVERCAATLKGKYVEEEIYPRHSWHDLRMGLVARLDCLPEVNGRG